MKKNILLTLIALMCAIYAQAYDFKSGDLYYNITSYAEPYTVEVTYQKWWSSDNYKLTSVIIPATVTYNGKTYSVTSIGNEAFSWCTRLTSVTIGNSVTSIGKNAFFSCTGLTSVIIGNSVTSIGSSAFNGCTGFTSITIPNSVTSIGYGAFKGCTGLTSITIGNSVTSIGSSAFNGCTGLTSITIPNSVTSIGSWAFYGCTGFTSITIPNSVTSIGYGAFKGCTGLTSITIGNSVTSIGSSAFNGCTGFTSITIPNSVTSIGYSAFNGCTGLTSATIGNNVPSIGYSAFYGCTGLTSVTIGNSVTSIESRAFSGCTGLTAISVSAGSPPGIQSDTFEDVPTNISIYVPCNAVKAYQTATYWSKFTNYIERFYPITVTTQDNAKGSVRVIKEATSCTDNTAIFEATANEHYYFDCWNDGNTDNPRTVSVEGGVTYTAMFGENIYTISATATNGRVEGAGYLVEDEGTGYYSYGTTATLTAVADEHYHFTQWSDGNTDNPRIVLVTGNAAYTAEFAIDQHNIGATAQNGRVEGAGTYDYGTTITLTATADEHYHFERWSDGNTTNPRKVTVEGDATYTAVFAPNQYTISATATNGRVEGAGKYDYGTTATLTAIANEHYHFTQWSDGNTDNPRTVAVEDNATYTAEFKPNPYTITVSAGGHGNVSGGGTYDYGTTATLTATADEHYHFTQWSDGNTDNPRTVSVIGDATYTAEFAIDQHTITATCDPQQGTVTGAGTYNYGTQVTLTAVANKGYEFAQWSNGLTYNPYRFTVVSDLTLEAEFIPATAIDNVSADTTTPQKVLINGQVYILRNGKTYTTTGVEVK